MINLGGICHHYELGLLRHADHHLFGLTGSELLCFIQNKEKLRNGAAFKMGKSLHYNHSLGNEIIIGLLVLLLLRLVGALTSRFL